MEYHLLNHFRSRSEKSVGGLAGVDVVVGLNVVGVDKGVST